MPSWFMKRFSSVSAYSITRRTICYARYTLIILYRTISFNYSSVSAYSITRRTICYFARYTLIILYRTISFNYISTRT